jgi:hypothetical protein
MKVLVISALFLSSQVMASAFPSLRQLSQGNFAVSQGERQDPPEAPKSCVDFSGEWVGECTDHDGDVMSEEMTLVQDQCDSLSFVDDEETLTVTFGVPFIYDLSKMKVDPIDGYFLGVMAWSPSFEELIFPLSIATKFDVTPVMSHSKSKYFMDGEQLVTTTTLTTETVTDPSIPFIWSETCIYNKVK